MAPCRSLIGSISVVVRPCVVSNSATSVRVVRSGRPAGLEPIAEAGLEALDDSAMAGGQLPPTGPAPKGGKFVKKKVRTGSQWDSTLLYVGGGLLALMLIGGTWL